MQGRDLKMGDGVRSVRRRSTRGRVGRSRRRELGAKIGLTMLGRSWGIREFV